MAGHIGDMVSQAWNTPKEIVEAVRATFGGQIDLDPCDNEFSCTNARLSYRLPERDGLKESWDAFPNGEPILNIFVNPPYGRDKARGTTIEDWIEKAVEARMDGADVIMLIPSSTETTFWHELVWPRAALVNFLRGRMAFELNGERRGSSTKGSALVYFGRCPEDFVRCTEGLGWIVLAHHELDPLHLK